MKKNINLIVESNENNLRIDTFITKKESLISRTRVKNLILKKKLKLNNEIINSPSKRVSIGDKINLEIPEPKEASLKPYDFKLEIIYEDDDLLVIDKPMTRTLPELHEDNDCFVNDLYVSKKNENTNQNTEKYKVKRESEKKTGPSKKSLIEEHFKQKSK